MNHIEINLFKDSRAPFLQMLSDENIEYGEIHKFSVGAVLASGTSVGVSRYAKSDAQQFRREGPPTSCTCGVPSRLRRYGGPSRQTLDIMTRNVSPFPEPPIAETDAQGLRVPPWIKYPNIPLGSVGWRMGVGEDYWFSFRDWWVAQPGAIRLKVKTSYPEPEAWSGFYGRLKDV